MNRRARIAIVAIAGSLSLMLAPSWQALAAESDDEPNLFYVLGVAISDSLKPFDLKEDELKQVVKGLEDAISGKAGNVNPRDYMAQIGEIQEERQASVASAEKVESEKFTAAEASKPGAIKTESGLILIPTTEGAGASPAPTDTVKVHYHGTLRTGSVFDSSVERGEPATFPLDRVIPCWTEGVGMMKVGGKARLICPSDIAYGDRGRPPSIPGGATLVFEVELIEIGGTD
jgi:FKBP-type peptidyl-prolyl cis-trans isomerase FkpA